MKARALLAGVILGALSGPATADDEDQKLEDEVRAVELQRDTLAAVREIDLLLATARDHARPTDLAEKLIDQPKVGYFLRRAHELAKELARGLDPVPPWLERYERAVGAVGKVRKAAAAAHALETLIVATMDAESSTGAEKLRQMGGLIKDVSALVKANPLLTAYASAMGSVVENMAESAVVIEKRRQETNRAIAEVRQAIVGTDYREPDHYDHPLDAAVDAADEELRRLQQRLRARAYEEVEAAEEHCAQRHGTTTREVSRLRREAAQDRLALRRLARAKRMLGIRGGQLRWLIRALEADVRVLALQARYPSTEKEAVESRSKLRRTRGRLQVFERELADLEASEGKLRRDLVGRFREIERQYRTKRIKLRAFDECVKGQLKDAEHVDPGLLREWFPQYATRHRSLAVKDVATLRPSLADHSADQAVACLEAPRPARGGGAFDLDRRYRLVVAEGKPVSRSFVVPRGTEVRASLEHVQGKASLRMLREVLAEADLRYVDVNIQRIEDLRAELQKTGRTWVLVSPDLHLYLGPRQQRYKVQITCTRGPSATLVLHLSCRDRGDLGLRTDAGTEDAPLPVLPLGREFVGYIVGNDPGDDYLIPYVAAHTRIRITLKVNRVGLPDGTRAWERIRLDRWSEVCNEKGERQDFRLATLSGDDTLVHHGQRRVFEFITDQPGHFRIRLTPKYGGWHEYRIEAEILEPIRVERDGVLVGLLGYQQSGWYCKVPGQYALRIGFKTEVEARRHLLGLR